MGLDISYYKNVRALTPEETATLMAQPEDNRADWADEHGIERVYVNDNFPGREEGILGEWVVPGERSHFRAYSYSGYGRWRSELARLVGHDQEVDNPPPGPFMELINFADNEGVIGPAVSAKLAKDFADWQERADAHGDTLDDADWFRSRYADWRLAFETAAQSGYVDFH